MANLISSSSPKLIALAVGDPPQDVVDEKSMSRRSKRRGWKDAALSAKTTAFASAQTIFGFGKNLQKKIL
jgi:hypothetical protein